jgi:DNA-binding SARP family transcriptional activator
LGKPFAMLAYLAVRGEARRDEVVDLLWGDMPEAKARNAFRQALHRLRTALGEEIVPQDREMVLLKLDAIETDRDAFLGAVSTGNAADAVRAYRGDFLEGFELGEPVFDQWADGERIRLGGLFETALRNAARQAMDDGRWHDALEVTHRLTQREPFDESVALQEASIHVAAGRGSAGAESLRRFVGRLREELDVPAPRRVSEMLARIERSEAQDAPGTPPRSAATPESTRAQQPALPPFVGREQQITEILALVRALPSEQGAAALVVGEGGIGKSRLLDETLKRARSLGPLLVLRGRERAGGGAVPYASVGEALRAALHAPGISGASQHLLAEAARLLPELRDSFELPPVGDVNDEASRLRFFEGIAAFIDAIAYERPTVLALDDLHNASSSTLDLLGYLIQRLHHSPVLFLLTARDGQDDDSAGRLGRFAEVQQIGLPPLSDEDTGSLISALRPSGRIDAVEREQLVALAGGHPLRIVDLVRRSASGEPLGSLPLSVRSALRARLEGCAPSQRRLFFATSLLQRSAPLRLLAAAAHLPESAAFEAAQVLERIGLLSQDDAGYSVTHDITASFVVEMSGPAGRALLAGWAADALAHHGGSHAELAHLYVMAGRSEDAFRESRHAALSAASIGALSEAHRLLVQALTFAPDAATHAEVERLADALGWGRPRIAATPAEVPDHAASNEVNRNGADVPIDVPASPSGAPRMAPLRVRKALWLAAAAAVLLLMFALGRRAVATRDQNVTLTDSLLVVARGREHIGSAEIITGTTSSDPVLPNGEYSLRQSPAWADSVAIPWINARPSPDGHSVALERMTATGTDLYLISADRRDTATLATGGGDNIALGWAPDSRALLVSRARRLRDGSFDSDLFVWRENATALAPIDTAADRAVTEAEWSPDGAHIAWVARVPGAGQQDVFVSRPDGSAPRNVSQNPAEDYHIDWSPDGTLIAFTSERDGNAEIYALDIEASHLWRLTTDSAHDDHAVFSPDGRHIAFESTRGGQAAVYLMPSLGGRVLRVTPMARTYSLLGWKGHPVSFLDRLRIVGNSHMAAGDTLSLSIVGVDQLGNPFPLSSPRWSILDPGVLRALGAAADSGARRSFVGAHDGFARVVASVPGWRSDTLQLRIGSEAAVLLADDFSRGLDTTTWMPLGYPAPIARHLATGGDVVVLNGDMEWESGILSRKEFALREGLRAEARLDLPFTGRGRPASSVQLSLVVPPERPPNQAAPQFTARVATIWNGESARMTYMVERESWSEPASALGTGDSHLMRMVVQPDGHVAFYADGKLRWRSTLRVDTSGSESRTRLWIGGRATDGWGAVSRVSVGIGD